MNEETTPNVTRIGRNDISIDALDEINDHITDCITIADLIQAHDVTYPIPERTVLRAGYMIAEMLRRVDKLQSAGGAS